VHSGPREVVLEDNSSYAVLSIVGLPLAGAIAVGAGILTQGWYSIPLAVIGVLLVLLGIGIGVTRRVQGAVRLRLTEHGLIYSIGDKEEIVPADAIEGIGLLRPLGRGASQLTLWYDRAKLPELPKGLRRRERQSGQVRLAMVMDEVGCMSQNRVAEIRTFVQTHRLGEWRNRKAPSS
jgi:hypothetical protein